MAVETLHRVTELLDVQYGSAIWELTSPARFYTFDIPFARRQGAGSTAMQLTVREAAQFLNVSEKTVYRWAGAGEVPVYRINGQYRFNPEELLEWATARNLKVSTSVFRPKEGAEASPGIAQAIEQGGIHYKLPGADKPAALRAMVDAVRLPEGTDRTMLYEVLAARESLGTTAVGNGIAIPHVRNPLVLEVPSPRIPLFFLERPLDFGAADGRPVQTLFWLIASTVKQHLLLLSRLASVIRDPAVQAALARQAAAEDVLREVRAAEAAIAPPPGRTA
jgi:PTS system nitrogen regulatory IIA component